MQYISVANWERFQQYKDRDPKWIKLYRDILDNYEFAQLDEISQAHLIKIWLLAAKLDNKIPYDPVFVSQRIGAKSTVDLETLVNAGFMRLYSSVQNCTNLYTETEKETEGETEKETEKDMSIFDDSVSRFFEIVERNGRTVNKRAGQIIDQVREHLRVMPDGVDLEKLVSDFAGDDFFKGQHPETWIRPKNVDNWLAGNVGSEDRFAFLNEVETA